MLLGRLFVMQLSTLKHLYGETEFIVKESIITLTTSSSSFLVYTSTNDWGMQCDTAWIDMLAA